MTTIFVSHAEENTDCAETIRRGLEAKGYTSWREPGYPGPTEASYPHMIENAILGSAAVVLVWSSAAAQAAWVARHILFAQRLKKLILPIVLDGTALPNTLIVDSNIIIISQPPYDDAVTQLLPHLPQPDSTDPLIKLLEQAANNDFNSKRKEAIDQAAAMLQRNEHREEILAILEYLANHDLMMGVRDKAQEALEADAKKIAPPPPFLNLGDPRDIFGVRCKNGHITYFNKRRACSDTSSFVRERAGKKLNELHLKCGTCDEIMAVLIDCEGY